VIVSKEAVRAYRPRVSPGLLGTTSGANVAKIVRGSACEHVRANALNEARVALGSTRPIGGAETTDRSTLAH